MLRCLYYLALTSLVLGQLTNISKSNGVSIYIFDVMVFIFAFASLIYFLSVKKKLYISTPFFYFFGFIFVGTISLFLNSYKYNVSELLSSGFYVVRFIFYAISAISIYNLVLSKKMTKSEVHNSIIASGIALVIFGIIQMVLLPDFETLDPLLGWDPHKNRLASTFFDPNFVGAYLVVCFMVALDVAKKVNIKSIVIVTILLLGIVLTFSRSAWLMLSVFLFIYGIAKNRMLLFISFVTIFLAYYSVPRIQTRISGTTDPADSAQFRWVSWANTVEIIKDAPVLGVGYNTLRYVQKDYGFTDEDTFLKHSAAGSDSSLLFVAATSGIVGLTLFLAGLLGPIFKKDTDFLYKLLIVSLLIESQFINSLFYPQIMFAWMLLLPFSLDAKKEY